MEVVSSLLLFNSSFVALVLLGGWGLGSTIGGCSFVALVLLGGWGLGSTIGGCSFEQLEVVLL